LLRKFIFSVLLVRFFSFTKLGMDSSFASVGIE
jgi:hypothetical protein